MTSVCQWHNGKCLYVSVSVCVCVIPLVLFQVEFRVLVWKDTLQVTRYSFDFVIFFLLVVELSNHVFWTLLPGFFLVSVVWDFSLTDFPPLCGVLAFWLFHPLSHSLSHSLSESEHTHRLDTGNRIPLCEGEVNFICKFQVLWTINYWSVNPLINNWMIRGLGY